MTTPRVAAALSFLLVVAGCGSSDETAGDTPASTGKTSKKGGAGGGSGGPAGGAAGTSGASAGTGGAGVGGTGAATSGAGGTAGASGSRAATGGGGGATGGAGGLAGAGGGGGSAGTRATGGAGGAAGTAGGGCLPPTVDCSGACVDPTSDVGNCGACGKACGAAELCCAKTCVATQTCEFAVTSIEPATGWQNGGDYRTIKGTGFVPGVKVFLDDGRAPVRVIDSETLLVMTPPHTVATVDVHVQLIGATATLAGAFAYVDNTVDLPWQTSGMQIVRGENPGVAVMQNGKVLVAGGTTVPDSTANAADTAEVFDRTSVELSAVTNAMSTVRWQNAAVPMMDGRVLVIGGACHADLSNCVGTPSAADLYDPVANAFTPTKPLSVGRSYIRAALMPDGKVFVASANDASIELFDPETESFTVIPHAEKHVFGFATRLRDGRIMLGGGDIALGGGTGTQVEIFDPDTLAFTATTALTTPRSMLTAHTLPDGRVIVIGGSDMSAGAVKNPQSTMELWDPKTEVWTTMVSKLALPRTWHASALIRDGSVLVLGGYTITGSCTPSDASEQVDPVADAVLSFGTLPHPNTEWNAVTMLDGSVIAVGGGACGASSALPDMDFLPGKR